MAGSHGTGRFTATFADAYIGPDNARGAPPVVYCHGAGGDAREGFGRNAPAIRPLLEAIAAEGFPIVCPTATELWGNSTNDTRIDNALTWVRANRGAGSHAPFIVGASMGTVSGLDWAADHACSGLVGLVPIVDLQAMVTNNTLGLRTSINTAYGRASGDTTTLPAGSNPATMTTALAQIPQQLWYATDDTASANITTYATAVGCDLRSVGALGHTDAAMAAASATDILRFITRRFLR